MILNNESGYRTAPKSAIIGNGNHFIFVYINNAESISIAKECAAEVDTKANELSLTAERLSEEAAKWTL